MKIRNVTNILVPLILVVLPWFGCSDNSVSVSTESIVVRAFLYANEPVRDIRLSGSVQIGSEDTIGPPITDATVTLTKNGLHYLLRSDSSRAGYYYYPGNDLTVTSPERFGMEIFRGNDKVTASTTVPPSPQTLTVSTDTLIVHVRTIFGDFKQVYSNDSCVVRWTGTESELYYTVLKNVDPNATAIISDSTGFPNFSFQPTSQLRFRVPVQTLRYTGRHSVRVYRVNQEYADLYRSRQQDTRSLNEPLTNVKGGLGVFSAFASAVFVFGDRRKIVNVHFQDPANTKNNYRFVEVKNGVYQKFVYLYDDRVGDGGPIASSLLSRDDTLRTGDAVQVQLQCIDKGAFDYFRTMNQAGGSGGGGGPQATSPANPVSNISNGALGYFSAFSVRSRSIVIP